MTKQYDYLIVGAGYAGAVCARQLADHGKKVLVVDKRSHIAGNAYDEKDSHGVLIHPYGPHIFHTNSKKIFDYLSQFTKWRFYEHRVLANIKNEYYPIPINRTTINKVFGIDLQEDEVESFLDSKRVPKEPIKTSEDVVLNSVGHELCELFFRGYTKNSGIWICRSYRLGWRQEFRPELMMTIDISQMCTNLCRLTVIRLCLKKYLTRKILTLS